MLYFRDIIAYAAHPVDLQLSGHRFQVNFTPCPQLNFGFAYVQVVFSLIIQPDAYDFR